MGNIMTQTWLAFTSEENANIAQQKICDNAGYPDGQTECWAIPRLTEDGSEKRVFAKPKEALMDGVDNYTEEDYSNAWFPSSGLI